jgi:uncharacterized repeat protein (TIGR03803 family)
MAVGVIWRPLASLLKDETGSCIHQRPIATLSNLALYSAFRRSGLETACIASILFMAPCLSRGLTLGTDGSFYGSTSEGGVDNFGTIFKITSEGDLTTLYSFTNGTDGPTPYAPPVEGVDRNFYGTTSTGTAYKIRPSGTFTLLAKIPGTSWAPLVLGGDGYFYGTTTDGGKNGFGTVFKMPPSGVVTVVYNFDGTHGARPFAAVIQASDGNFYGNTAGGGS